MNNIGPVGGDLPYRLPNKLSLKPLDMETSSATPPTLPDKKPLIKDDGDGDQFIKKRVTENPVVDATWDSFAVKPELTALTAPAAKSDAFQPTEASNEETKLVTAEFMKIAGTTGTTGPNASMIASRIIDGLA
jgi:hypothetical protein